RRLRRAAIGRRRGGGRVSAASRRRHARAGVVAVLAMVFACAAAGLAHAATDPRLAAKLDARTAAAVTTVIDDARLRGLPTEPLIARALEGASRKASDAKIITAVRHLASSLE